jgi:hypothetical protein
MTKKTQKRDNSYYLRRLEIEHPAIFADFKAGKYASARQALNAANLKRVQRPLNVLKNAWKKASAKQQADFLLWCGSVPHAHSSLSTVVDTDRRLLPGVAARIRQIMDRRSLRPGDVMREVGLKSLNASLAGALERNHRISTDLAGRLKDWLYDNRAI